MKLNYYRAGAGEPLVLIHGIGHRWQGWQPVLGLLAPHREVIALDLPGFASSPPAPPGIRPEIAPLTSLVSEFLDELGLPRPHVAGNSLGGWIALELAKQDRARTATALSPAGFHNGPESVFQRTSFWITVRFARLIAPRAEQLLASPLARRLAFSQMVARPERIDAASVPETIRDLAGAPWFDETLEAITSENFTGGEQISVPVTIGWGEHDRVLLPRQAARAARAIPRARLITLRGCGHVPMSDDPEQVAQVLLEGSQD
jgi:pimeloyl-ACP methyl ester carboxylesterase